MVSYLLLCLFSSLCFALYDICVFGKLYNIANNNILNYENISYETKSTNNISAIWDNIGGSRRWMGWV